MFADFLFQVFAARATEEAMVWRGHAASYADLLDAVRGAAKALEEVPRGAVVSLEADFSPNAVAALLALIERGCVVVPLTESVNQKKAEFRRVAEVETIVTVGDDDALSASSTGVRASHELLAGLKALRHPGLILFSSGSTGKSKAAVHDFVPLLSKFKTPRSAKRMISFLLFDHIGGVNTLFYALSNGGCVVTLEGRGPEEVALAIERHRVQVLPTSPTFLNLVLLSGAFSRHDVSSLELVTYGTEPMPEATLKRFHESFPSVQLLQTYGLSEVGILRSKSRASDSLWVKVGGEGFETRVRGGLLEIKARSAMLGYLNAPSPYTEDGWFKTGDRVEVDGEWLKILGRDSEMINVGGQKVYPAEVEGVLQSMEGVAEALVVGEPHPLTGQLVKATVALSSDEAAADFRRRMWDFCRGRLEPFKIPQKVVVSRGALHSERFKKLRAQA